MLKIKLIKNEKKPACEWSNINNHFKEIDSSLFNSGLICGRTNNIIVLDVDEKDNGVEEMKLYYEKFGAINTLKQRSPNNGYHLFFKYTASDEDDQFLIDNYLLNKSKFRNKGLDIRSNGGYIVIEPSQIDGKKYEFVNNYDINEMPHNLIEFLLDGLTAYNNHNNKQKEKPKQPTDITKYTYDITDDELKQLLMQLDDSYCNETKKWIIITNILKGLNKYNLWDDWSTMSELYDVEANLNIWESIINPIYDINYITHKLKLKPINRYKPYEMLQNTDIRNKRTLNQPYIKLTLDELKTNDTIVMKSTTGTGKTTTTAQTIFQYNQNHNKKVLSIISKRSLCDQHITSFKNAGIHLTSYLDKDKKLNHDNIVVCINSIMILSKMRDIEFSKYIVYIDEIASFLNDVTHNETLRGKLKLCYQILMRIIKNCHKLIVSDAKITDNVFNFIKTREKRFHTTTYIENTYKKYDKKPAIRIRDEQLYLDTLIDHVKTNQYFLCASDSCSTITKFFLECRKHFATDTDTYTDADIDDKFILITANSPYMITDAFRQFANKFVFYSPTIVFGVDFTIDQEQDVFIYNKGNTLDPSSIFQQTTRTRNIKTLYYYSELQNKVPEYFSLEECKTKFENICLTSSEINAVCIYSDEDDNEIIIKNTFFDLFVYNEYVNDIFQSNKTSHYQQILLSNGFILSELGDVKKMDKKKKIELTESLNEIKETAFQDLIESKETSNIIINEHVKVLNLCDAENEVLETFKDQIIDKFKLEEHLNIIRLLKDESFINHKITQLEKDNYTVTNLASSYHKIKQIISLAKQMNIQRLQVDSDFTFVDINDQQYNLIAKIFRICRVKPSDKDSLMKLYISMLRNLGGSDFIKSHKGTTRKSRKITYELNTDLIKNMIELNKYSNKYLNYYDQSILSNLGIEIPEIPVMVIGEEESLLDKDIFSED